MSEFRNRKVLVTGAGGFVGSTLVERLAREGARVRAFVRYNSRGQDGWLDALDVDLLASLEIVRGDLKDPDAVHRAAHGCEIVLHLGALVAIPYSYAHPCDFVQTNVLGTAHVLDACLRAGVERVVHTSTSEVYGTARAPRIDEASPVIGQSPYAASKIAADQLASSYHRSFGLPVAILRPFNTFGPRQSARAVIPSIVGQCLSESEVRLGSLHTTRDLTFVDDTVEGFVRIATAKDVVGEVVNVGSGKEISIGDLAETLLRMTGSGARIVSDPERMRPEKSEVERLCADTAKAKRLLGWTPRIDLESGLARTIAWLEKNLSLYKTRVYNV